MLKFLFSLITPENIINIILSIISIISICLVFDFFNEKWWKGLIPFYGDFVFYKICYNTGFMIIIEVILNLINVISFSKIRNHLIFNIIDIIKGNFIIEQIDSKLLIICLIIYFITLFFISIYKRITYLILSKKLGVDIFMQILTFVFPDLFLFIDLFIVKRKAK